MNKWVVITSVNRPQKRYLDYVERGWKIVVVGDLKSPDHLYKDWVSDKRHYLSAQMQSELYPDLSSAIGFNTYARKNLGYLYALSNGAQIIWESDDDTFIREELQDPLALFELAETYAVSGTSKLFNPYNFFAPESGLWPRGYPLKKVSKDRLTFPDSVLVKKQKLALDEIDFIQTLVNLEPDVDAIYRLVFGDQKLEFPFDNKLVLIENGLVSPGNTQSTFWKSRKSLPYMYVPRFIDFRFCDILKIYIAQSGLRMAYAGFIVEQIRNAHDYLEDFRSEVSCYLNSDLAIEIVTRSINRSIVEVYRELIEVGICKDKELEVLQIFLNELRNLEVKI